MSTPNSQKIAIIGPADMVSGFSALGVEVFDAKNADEAMEQLKTLTKQSGESDIDTTEYAVVCVIEDLMVDVDLNEYSKITSGPLPAVIILPGPSGSHGVALQRLRRLAEQAVGSAII
jgi:V/A-type H+-transporting ATPase subunit F